MSLSTKPARASSCALMLVSSLMASLRVLPNSCDCLIVISCSANYNAGLGAVNRAPFDLPCRGDASVALTRKSDSALAEGLRDHERHDEADEGKADAVEGGDQERADADRAAEQGCHAGDKRTTNCGEHGATEHGGFAGAAGHGSRCATNSFAPYDADDGNNVQHDIHTFLLDVFREDEVQGSSKMTPSSSSASFSSNSFSRRTSSSFTPIASAIVLQVS